jgi:hypothetical protein
LIEVLVAGLLLDRLDLLCRQVHQRFGKTAGAKSEVVDWPPTERDVIVAGRIALCLAGGALGHLGDVDDVTSIKIEPIGRDAEIGAVSHMETQDIHIPRRGCLDIISNDQNMLQMQDPHIYGRQRYIFNVGGAPGGGLDLADYDDWGVKILDDT